MREVSEKVSIFVLKRERDFHSSSSLLAMKAFLSMAKDMPFQTRSLALGIMSIKNDSEIVIMDSYEEFQSMKQKMWGISVGLTLYGVGVEVSMSKLRGQIRGMMKNSTRAFTIASYIWHAFDLELDWRDAQLDDYFTADVKGLPATYDQYQYRRFIEAYGTHFFDKVSYGCKWNYTLAFDKDLMSNNRADWSRTQIGIGLTYSMGGFGIGIGVDFARFKNESKVDGTFARKSDGKEELLGGDELLAAKGLAAWYPTCGKNRAILLEKSKLKPIAELFRDSSRKQAMIQALKDYAAHP